MTYFDLLQESYSIVRSEITNSSSPNTESTIETGKCFIDPVRNKTEIIREGYLGKQYKGFFESTSSIKSGDKIVAGDTYVCEGVSYFDDLVGEDNLIEAVLIKQ